MRYTHLPDFQGLQSRRGTQPTYSERVVGHAYDMGVWHPGTARLRRAAQVPIDLRRAEDFLDALSVALINRVSGMMRRGSIEPRLLAVFNSCDVEGCSSFSNAPQSLGRDFRRRHQAC